MGYRAFPSSFGGELYASWDILLEPLTECIRLELVILVCCNGDYPAKQLQKSGVDVIAWPSTPISSLSCSFAKDVLTEFVREDAHSK
eukprot:1604967-Amphidinium_carterae.1